MASNNWSRAEFMVVMNLYTKIPYGQFSAKNTEVKKVANLLNRTPDAVSIKLVHFANLDPYHKPRLSGGFDNPGKPATAIYNEFAANWDEMLYESEVLLAQFQEKTIEENYFTPTELKELRLPNLENKQGLDVERIVKQRVHQNLFRAVILGNYANTCAVCKLDLPELMTASHILKWSDSQTERLNPENGICLCGLHDIAFEKGLLRIQADYTINISTKINDLTDKESAENYFLRYHEKSIILPQKSVPNPAFLQTHFDRFL
jgi:putative restriction endonuclease